MTELDLHDNNLIKKVNIGDVFEETMYDGTVVKGKVTSIMAQFDCCAEDVPNGAFGWSIDPEYQVYTIPDTTRITSMKMIRMRPEKFRVYKKTEG